LFSFSILLFFTFAYDIMYDQNSLQAFRENHTV
jgi:hypothetical protein